MSLGFDDLVDMNAKNLMLVDSLNMAFRWRKQINNWANKLVETINSLAGSYTARDVLVLGDGGSTYRKGIYDEYKGNRNKEDQTDEEKAEWKEFFEEYEAAMAITAQSYPILKYKGVEADDIAAYLVSKLKGEYDHIWMISSDRDWDLLVENNVSRFSLFSKKEFTVDNWSTHYPYPREMHLDVKVLGGDTGDNIPGIKGVGPARAKQILDRYGPSAFDVMDSVPLPGTAKYIQALNEFEFFELNYELMDLVTYCETAIKEHKSKIDLQIKFLKGELDCG